MGYASCNGNLPAQPADWCPPTQADTLQSIVGLLPPGPAWEAASIDGTNQHNFSSALAEVVTYAYVRLCEYIEEFYCTRAVESVDQWMTDYGLPDECDPYGFNLCAKVNALGGQTCSYFTQLALDNAWVVTCDAFNDNDPIAGCFECGCTPMGPTPQRYQAVMPALDPSCACAFGSVVQHPQPQFWAYGTTNKAFCTVPGSNLGWGPDTDESCCMICGWYELPVVPIPAADDDPCMTRFPVITFNCPAPTCPDIDVASLTDSTGTYVNFSNANTWEVTVYWRASMALQNKAATPGPISAAGNFEVGCVPLCAIETNFIVCFLEKIKPAHTKIITLVDYS